MRRNRVLTTLATLTTLVLGCSSPKKTIQNTTLRQNPTPKERVGQLDLSDGRNYALSIQLSSELRALVEVYGANRFGELLDSHVKEVIGELYVPSFAEAFKRLREEYIKVKMNILERSVK